MLKLNGYHVLLVGYLLLLGGGAYYTHVEQGNALETLNRKLEVSDEGVGELASLRQRAQSLEQRAERLRQTNAERYKRMPQTMSTPRMVRYLTSLTQEGFKTFNLGAAQKRTEEGYRAYAVAAEGRAFFSSLYHFVWTLEHNRPFYRIRNLQLSMLDERETDEETGRPSMDVLVAFQMEVEALYDLTGGLSEAAHTRPQDERHLPRAKTEPHPPVPAQVLPPAYPSINPFYPLVFKRVPPNEHGRLNVETARFLSIVDGAAVFETEAGITQVREGERVYLGRIVHVDPMDGRVVARLNKGGIVERVTRSLHAQEDD